MKGKKTDWNPEMIKKIINDFPCRFSRDIAHELDISIRTVIRKARELGIEKEPGFLERNAPEIQKRAVKAHPPHPKKGQRGWAVPNSEHTRFRKGNISVMATDRDVVEKVRGKRNETIRKEKLRLKYDLKQKTKLKLVNIW